MYQLILNLLLQNEAVLRYVSSTQWMTVFCVLCLVILAVTRMLYDYRFLNFVQLFISDKYLLLERNQNDLSSPFTVLLISVQIIAASLFIHLFLSAFQPYLLSSSFLSFIQILALYSLFVIGKLLIEKIVGSIFMIDGIMDSYLFIKTSYRNYVGLFILFITILLIYTLEPTQKLYTIIGVALFFSHLIIMISIFRKYNSLISQHLFYFILYLCALEIAPYMILYKVIMR